MKSQLRQVQDGDDRYTALMFVCPGCMEDGRSGLHMLPVNATEIKKPSWEFDGNLEAPTLNPSILTKYGPNGSMRCHSYLRNGIFEFLDDSTHSLSGQKVEMPDLPEWVED